jgi:hypothetical protein
LQTAYNQQYWQNTTSPKQTHHQGLTKT